MKRIHLICEPKRSHEKAIDVQVEGGSEVIEATDEPGTPIVYSCRGVACGSCFVFVDDPSMFEPPDDNELAVLHSMGADCPNHRMACALRFKEDAEGTVKIRMAY